MNKPVTIIVDELKKNIVSDINNAKLPFFIVEYILKDLVQEIHVASLQQLESDKEKYIKTIAIENKEVN